MFGSLVSERFYHVSNLYSCSMMIYFKGYSIVATIFACLSNSVLIYVIISTNINQVIFIEIFMQKIKLEGGTVSMVATRLRYHRCSHLTRALFFDAGSDSWIYACSDWIQAVHITEFGYIFWSYRVLNLPTEQAVWISQCFTISSSWTSWFSDDMGAAVLSNVRAHSLSLCVSVRDAVQVSQFTITSSFL